MAGVVTEPAALRHRTRILVLDDDAAISGTIVRYLRGYDVDVVDCVADAIDQIGRTRYDLLLLDRRLPDGLGDDVIVRARARGDTVPILVMSGEVASQTLSRPQHGHADGFIEKPFVREALVTRIEHLITSRRERHQADRERAELIELQERRDREIETARTIFGRVFARGQFDRDRVRHLVLPADRLAGDVVFGATTIDDRYRWMIGDVTGHTLASALVTLPLAGIFYRAASEHIAMADVLALMERELVQILPPSMFCVAAMCELDRRAGTLQVWNGGNPDVLIRHLSGEITRIPSMCPPLAVDRFAPPVHDIVEHAVSAGDRVFAFSDGLVELRDRHDQMIGFDHLLDIACTAAPAAIFGRFLDCIPDYSGATAYDDDISLIEVIV